MNINDVNDKVKTVALTRDFRETILARARRDPEFRDGLLTEGIQCLLEGEVDIGKAVLRNYINATVGFEELAAQSNIPTKSLMRMFGASGNPQSANLFGIIAQIQRHEGLHLNVTVTR